MNLRNPIPASPTLCLLALTLVACTAAATAAQPTVYVVLVGGQSNAVGWGYHRYLQERNDPLAEPQTDVQMITRCGMLPKDALLPLQCGAGQSFIRRPNAPQQVPDLEEPVRRFGPELSMGRTLRDGLSDETAKLVLVKYAVGGSHLFGHWRPDGTADAEADGKVYQAFQGTVRTALATLRRTYPDHRIVILGMAWIQGESDALKGKADAYRDNLTRFVADLRATFTPDLPFVLAKLSPNQHDHEGWPVVRAAQDAVAAADPRVATTETLGDAYQGTPDFPEGRIHYGSAALLQIGRDLGHALLAIVQEQGIPAPLHP